MKNIALFIISLLFSITSFAQTSYMEEIYKKGVSNFIFENYKTADSLFSLYINKYDKIDIDAYYNLAVSKLKLADTCGFCHNLWKASVLGDLEANDLFKESCLPYKEKLKQFYKTNDSLNSLRPEKELSYNYLFDLAIYKSEVGDICFLCNIFENDISFSVNKNLNDTVSFIDDLEKNICWLQQVHYVDSIDNKIRIFNTINTHICTAKKQYVYSQEEIRSSSSDNNFLFETSEVQKGYIMKVVEGNIIENIKDYKLYIDTTETKSKDTSKYEIKICKNVLPAPLDFVEEMPNYRGSESTFLTNLYKNLKYPEEAINKKISGTVIVNFIVEIDGRITNVKALNDIVGGCGLAAENLIKSLPKWNPGKQNGKPVRVRYSLPVKFD